MRDNHYHHSQQLYSLSRSFISRVLKLFLDQNFNHRILRGLLIRIPDLDFKSTQILNKENATDPRLLKLAALENRVIVTHDHRTFPKHAYDAVVRGEKMTGVIVVLQDMSIGNAIDELELIIQCSDENAYENLVEFLPISG